MRLPLRNREFRAVLVTEMLSVLGDQLTRVALALLVFARTGSAGLSGLTYALTYLPTVAGGFLLSGLADRWPRREVLIGIDLTRAAIVLVMAIPGLPLGVLAGLVAASAFLIGPYQAARLALLRDILPQELFGTGMALRQSVNQAAALAGFGAGGFLATAFTPSACLLVDAVTFTTAAVVIRSFVGRRPAAAGPGQAATFASTWRLIVGSPKLRAIYLMVFSALFFIAPEALAVALAAEKGLDPRWGGVFMASAGLCSIVVLPLFARFVTEADHPRVFPWVCFGAGAPLLVVAGLDDPYVMVLVFGLSGAIWAVLIVISVSTFAALLPAESRARGMGIAASSNVTSHGAGAALAGLLADRLGVAVAISLLGLAGVLYAVPAVLLWRRAGQGASPIRANA